MGRWKARPNDRIDLLDDPPWLFVADAPDRHRHPGLITAAGGLATALCAAAALVALVLFVVAAFVIVYLSAVAGRGI